MELSHNHESSFNKSFCSASLSVSSTGEAVTATSGAFGIGASNGIGAPGMPGSGGNGIGPPTIGGGAGAGGNGVEGGGGACGSGARGVEGGGGACGSGADGMVAGGGTGAGGKTAGAAIEVSTGGPTIGLAEGGIFCGGGGIFCGGVGCGEFGKPVAIISGAAGWTTGGVVIWGSGAGNAGGGAARFACNSRTASVSNVPVLRKCAISEPIYAMLAR